MPLVKLSMLKGFSQRKKHEIVDMIHKAMVYSLKVPESNKNFRIKEYLKKDFYIPPDNSSMYIIIEITMMNGRTIDAKRELYKGIVENLKKSGFNPNDIMIVIHEEEKENWGIKGGKPGSEVDLGYNVKV
ncbi:MAG: tautomerase family protein [Spirochaetes bacterium]|nr:tautomerase family protein [Spirochaetota bacterium]